MDNWAQKRTNNNRIHSSLEPWYFSEYDLFFLRLSTLTLLEIIGIRIVKGIMDHGQTSKWLFVIMETNFFS